MTAEQVFNRFSIALFDFEKLIATQKKPPDIRRVALPMRRCFAAIVCYYRPFSPSEKDKNSPAASTAKA
jgi:hypothetical protein